MELVMISLENMNADRLNRRAFMIAGVGAAVALFLRRGVPSVEAGSPKEVKVVAFSDNGQRGDVAVMQTVTKTDAEWKKQLSREAYDVTRRADTEIPYSGKYW